MGESIRIHIFEGLDDDEAAAAGARFTARRLEDGEILLTPGEPNHHLYALVEGDLRVALDDPDSPQNFPVELGESVGEMSIIDGSPVSAYVIAQGAATVLAIDEDAFWEMTAAHPTVGRNLLAILTARMRRQHESARQVLEQQLQLRQLAKELDHARRIQAGMLPTREPLLPEHPEIDIAASMEAAREVGGDFYDAFALDEERVAVVIGDVSGKGMPAALFMVEALTRLRVHLTSRANAPLDDVVRSMNTELAAENEENMFTTLFVVVVNVRTGEMLYVNGGHNRPVFARADGPFAYLEVHSGMLVGIWDESPYQLGRIELQPGDRFLLYTDGVTEAEDEERNLFSDDRLIEILDAGQPDDAIGLLRTVRWEVAAFVGEAVQSDDITMAAFVFRGPRA
ncbi:MAG: SpoIIE family protein phosphatase [Acidimicrobiia bacterium]|nr:SpoIIE family protein phosphatase [Acidimicrobiia bacterium]